jgi:hypothetical protein
MPHTKEELTADLLWRYVEHLRGSEDGPGQPLSRAELDRLVEVMDTASRVPEALETPESEAGRESVRARVMGGVAPSVPEVLPTAPPHTPRPNRLVPAWQFRAALGAALALGLVVSTVNVWHHPQPTVQVRRVPEPAPDIEPIDERRAHELVPQMVHDRLPRPVERNMLWHLIICPPCFDEYWQLKPAGGGAHTAQNPSHARSNGPLGLGADGS